MAEDKKVITIDDKDYTEDQLTDAQKVMINHINSLSQKIGSAEFNLDQLKVGKDAFIKMLRVSLDEAIIEAEEENGEGNAGWYTIVNESQIFDLIALQDVTDVLGEQTLAAGKYTQIRLTIEKAEITIKISGELEIHDLKIPSGNIKLTKGFWIYENETTVLTLDFDIYESVHKTGSDKYMMKPTIKIISE